MFVRTRTGRLLLSRLACPCIRHVEPPAVRPLPAKEFSTVQEGRAGGDGSRAGTPDGTSGPEKSQGSPAQWWESAISAGRLDSVMSSLWSSRWGEREQQQQAGPSGETASLRSLADVAISLRKFAAGMDRWSLADLSLGLYLLSVRHASDGAVDTWQGTVVRDAPFVEDLLWHAEVAWGAYAQDPRGVARQSMLREREIVKFVGKSSIMRPAYFIAVHTRRRLVILSIRGTRSVHDLITDLALHSSAGGQDLGGGFAHFGSVEAARWLVATEAANLRSLLESHPGFRLCIVGHSLGASTASLLAAILQADARTLLNVAPERISAVAFATPPCASRDLAARTAPFVASVVNCDDVVARMSTAALDRLRAEILSIEWATMLKDTLISRDWPPEFATNAATTIVRHVAKLQDRFLASGPSSSSSASSHPSPTKLQGGTAAGPAAAAPPRSDPEQERKFVELVEKVLSSITGRQEVSKLAIDFWRAMRASKDVDFERGAPLGEGLGRSCDLFVPGTVYQIVGGSALAPSSATKREDQLQSVKGVFPGPGGDDGWSRIGLASVSGTDTGDPSHLERGAEKGEAHASRLDHRDYRALVKGLGEPRPGRIVLSNSMLLDHRIENYYYGLRDVLKNCG